MKVDKHILLTIDVEDWFQVENFKSWIPFETWDQRELRVERNVHRLLDLFDSFESAGKQACSEAGKLESKKHYEYERDTKVQQKSFPPLNSLKKTSKADLTGASQPPSFRASMLPNLPTSQLQAKGRPKATFFVLGWIADKLPHLVKDIHQRGHEIASHGYNHDLGNQLSSPELRQDLTDSKKRLEDLTGSQVIGYRAPSFAINDDILKTIEDCGYLYDSSYNSFSMHGRYGKISLNGTGKKGIAHKLSENFYELPISNLPISTLGISAQFRHFRHFHLPWGGGGYFRLTPYRLFRLGVQTILKKDGAYLFYAHPWEIDPDQPKVNSASFNYKFRHYANLNKTKARLKRLIASFEYCRFVTCHEYLILTTGFGLQG